jgi:hypothetical protein
MDRKYTFVTVVFEDDYPLLSLQARSMGRYCPSCLIDSIIIIDNSNRALSLRWKSRLLIGYGRLANFVKFVNACEIARIPPSSSGLIGWWSQQVLKLMVSRIIDSSRYIVLDAKSHLVYTLQRDFLESSDGRACIPLYAYDRDHPLRPDLERVFAYLGLDLESHVHNFTPCTPPFIMYTNIVQALIDHFTTQEGKPFEHILIQNELPEFFLYTGYIIQSGIKLNDLYFFHKVESPIIWMPDVNGCTQAVLTATTQQSPFFGIHRHAILKMSANSRRTIANFWTHRELFTSNISANRFLVTFQIYLVSNILSRYVKSLPKRVSRLVFKTNLQGE